MHAKIMASQSIYRPIDGPNTIRLLRLLKSTKHYEDDPIRCELFEAPLPDNDAVEADYEALSYTWGDASQTGTIIIDGRPAAVTVNLHKALGHLRQTDKDRILWVDALCINQGDHSERMHQVGKMGNIYKKATEVIIWLGTTTGEIEFLFDAVLFLDKQMLKTLKPRVGDSTPLKTWMEAARHILAEWNQRNAEYHLTMMCGLKDLLNRSWWSRIWVVQEAANAPRARVQCSWRAVPTRTFALMPELMGVFVSPRQKVLMEVLPGPLRKHSWWNKDRSLEMLLLKFQHSQAKEECDQIYALLGMSSEAGAPGCPLQADYSLDMTRIVQNTISFLAFGELIDLEACPLPTWNLSNLRDFIPSLKPTLLAWALVENQPALVRKLLHCKPPLVAVNNRLPNNTKLTRNNRLCHLLPPPIHVAIASKKNSAGLLKMLLECEDLNVNLASFEPRAEYIERLVDPELGPAKNQFAALSLPESLGQPGLIHPELDPAKNQFTPLSLAASLGQLDVIHLLMKRPDIKLRQRDPAGFTSVERAVQSNKWEVVEALITMDADILKEMGWMLLHQAIKLNRPYIFRMLLAYEDVDVNRPMGLVCPLSYAAGLGRTELLQLLLNRQDLRVRAFDPGRYLPLERAFQGRQEEAANLLLAHGEVYLPRYRDSILMLGAVENDWHGMIKTLAKQGVDPDDTMFGNKPLPLALAITLHRREAVQALLEAGANPNPSPPRSVMYSTNTPKTHMWCPIVLAIQSGSLSLLETLMSTGRGAQITTWNTPGEAPLIYAIRRRDVGMVKILLSRGANVEAMTEGRQLTSFWLAVEYNAPRIMRLLADSGADFTISSSSHPQVYQGGWGLKFTPWFREFLEERELSASDVWRFEPGEEVVYNKTPLTRWDWETAGDEKF